MKRTLILITCLHVFFVSLINAQTKEAKQVVKEATNSERLLQMSAESKARFESNKKEALQLAKQKGWIIRKETKHGIIELQGVTENDQPLYYISTNADAAESVSTDEVHPGGSAGLDLDGTGMVVGEWDGGDVLTTHQEFTNTGTTRVKDKDGSSGTNYHATHVGGTMIAGGVESAAKGMAYNATLDAYDWNYDDSEMASAAADGLILSNHSYGYIAGWYWDDTGWKWAGDTTISKVEDYRFGFYGSPSRDLDELALNAPYYLIVKAAGNDRGDGPGTEPFTAEQDGGSDGYDCIGYKGNAKNILTVGAARDVSGGYSGNPADVEMTSFSSWGPADDGRIKPDICGNGYKLYSTYNGSNTEYNSISGTSMASPNVTGSLLLLQEHYSELNNTFMKATTLKALAIHTADECGPNPGPDYMFGWGLLNTRKAADLISNNQITSMIKEETINEGSEFTLNIEASGNEQLTATIVWADPAGTPTAPELDPTDTMLVNDLDMTLNDGSTDYHPWKLDGQNPSSAAKRGDNSVDNVEKIAIDNPSSGEYTLTINHEGPLSGGSQSFSLIVSGIKTGKASVTTDSVKNITTTSAEVYGTVQNNNGNTVTERGFVYNTSGAPSTADNKIQTGSGTGSFSTNISGLASCTEYYVRAYAINSKGTSYGEIHSFTVKGEPEIVPEQGSINFGDVFVNAQEEKRLNIQNNGCNTLSITNIESSSGEFTVPVTAIEILPGETASVQVVFSPAETGSVTGKLTIYNNDKDTSINLSGNAIQAPVVSPSPTSVSATVNSCGRTAIKQLTLSNTGGSELNAHYYAVSSGGEYTWKDSDDTNGPDFEWFDISSVGTNTNLSGDDTYVGINLPFTFDFYGEKKTSVKISTNGYLTFGNNASEYNTVGFPNTEEPNDIIAPLWSDMKGSGENYYYHDSENDRFIIQYSNWPDFNETGTSDFQVHLYENGEIYYYYKAINGNQDNGSVGIENKDGTEGVNIAYDENYIKDSLAVRISPETTWIHLNSNNSSIQSGNSESIDLEFMANGLSSGIHSADIIIHSNDPLDPIKTVPCTFTVNGKSKIALSDTIINYGDEFVNGTQKDTLTIYNDGCDTLEVNDMVLSSSEFLVAFSSFMVMPFDSLHVPVSFQPTSAGDFDETLNIYYSDVDTTIHLKGTAIASPELDISTDSIPAAITQCNDSITKQMTISNNGESDLIYRSKALDKDKDYKWCDNKGFSGPEFNWFEISSIGNHSGLSGDDNAVEIDLPFEFPFFGEEKSSVKIGTNGYITFGDNGSSYDSDMIPSSSEPNDFIALFWTDLDDGSGNNYYYYDRNNDRFIIQYSNWDDWDGTGTYDFQVHLYESGDIYLYYQNLNGELDDGTIGIENADGSEGLQIDRFGSYLENETAIRISKSPAWLSLSSNSADTLPGNGSNTIDVKFNGEGLTTGIYHADLVISSNDPMNQEVTVPVSFTVEGIPAISIANQTVDFGEVPADSTRTQSVPIINNGCDTLNISGINSSSNVFTTDVTQAKIVPGDSLVLSIFFSPATEGNFIETLSIENDDPDNPVKEITLTGSSVYVYPTNFYVSDENSNALADVNISVNGYNLTTDGTGHADTLLKDGKYYYTATLAGYEQLKDSLIIDGAALDENVTLNEATETYSITFNVTDGHDPLTGASVEIPGYGSQTANSSGQVVFDGVAAGNYDYSVKASGFITYEDTFSVTDSDVTKDVILDKYYPVTFNIKDKDLNPIPNAVIDIDGEQLQTDANGNASTELNNDTYTYTVSKNGYDDTTATITVFGSAIDREILMTETEYPVTFSITDQHSNPVENATIYISDDSLFTDSEGKATIELVNGSYVYEISKKGYEKYNGSLEVDFSAVTEPVDMVKLPLYTVTFTVEDRKSNRIQGAAIGVEGNELATDSEGSASVDLLDGDYSYTISKDGYEHYSDSIYVKGEAVSENAVMKELTYTVSFTVKNDNSEALQNATIKIAGNTLTTNANGLSEIELKDGLYKYTVSLNGYNTAKGEIRVEDNSVNKMVVLEEIMYSVTFRVSDNTENIKSANIEVEGSGQQSTDENGQAIFELSNGTYEYSIAADGYSDTTGNVVVENADVTEKVILENVATAINLEKKTRVRIYPNPVSEKFTIEGDRKIMKMKLMNLQGKLIKKKAIEAGYTKIDVSEIEAGVYILALEFENEQTATTRIMIQ